MKVGEHIIARTHADFLNKLLGKNLKGWWKSSFNLPNGKRIWMIELGPFISQSGWRNELIADVHISEKHIEGLNFIYNHNTYENSKIAGPHFNPADRIVFDIVKNGYTRKYIFRGVFRLNRENSTRFENVWDMITDYYKF